jgi:hypothetical protein
MKFQLRMTAHQYRMSSDGLYVVTQLMGSPRFPTATVEVNSANDFAEANDAIQAFGKLHVPCNVWAGCASPRKPTGFKAWQDRHRDNLFPVNGAHAVEGVHGGECTVEKMLDRANAPEYASADDSDDPLSVFNTSAERDSRTLDRVTS